MKTALIALLAILSTVFSANCQEEIYHLKTYSINGTEYNYENDLVQVFVDKKKKVLKIPDLKTTYKIKLWKLEASTGVNKLFSGLVSDAGIDFTVLQTLSVTGNWCHFVLKSTDDLIRIDLQCYAVAYQSKSDLSFEFKDKDVAYFDLMEGKTFLGTVIKNTPNEMEDIVFDLKEKRFYSKTIPTIDYKILSRKLIVDDKKVKTFEGLFGKSGTKYKYTQECDKELGHIKFKIKRSDGKVLSLLLNETEYVDTSDLSVDVESSQNESPPGNIEFKQPPVYSGTGFFIASDGLIATNNHIIKSAGDINVVVNYEAGPKKFKAKVIGVDEENDIAILSIRDNLTFKKLQTIPYNFNEIAEIGEQVFTIGYPLTDIMGSNFKLSNGIINSLTGYDDDERFYQTSIPLQSGNSGGPLIDESGNVIGITSTKLSGKRLGIEVENVNYAIKSQYLLKLMKDLKITIPKNNVLINKSIKTQVQNIKPFVCLIIAE